MRRLAAAQAHQHQNNSRSDCRRDRKYHKEWCDQCEDVNSRFSCVPLRP